jgi:hypothetical protein
VRERLRERESGGERLPDRKIKINIKRKRERERKVWAIIFLNRLGQKKKNPPNNKKSDIVCS